jgi:hypothetical protein
MSVTDEERIEAEIAERVQDELNDAVIDEIEARLADLPPDDPCGVGFSKASGAI